jgi:hypothetical protein
MPERKHRRRGMLRQLIAKGGGAVSHPCSARVNATSQTGLYGPVCTVVWEGRSRKASPYPDR